MAKSSTILWDALKDKISISLKKNERSILILFKEFIDNNSEVLFSASLQERVIWEGKREEKILNYIGITYDEITDLVKSTNLNDKSWFHRNRPIFIILILLIIHYLETKKKDEKNLCAITLAVIIYSGRQKNYFPHNTGPAFTNTMTYTINHLSEKFLLKTKKNVYNSLEHTIETALETYEKNLLKKSDEAIFDFISAIVTRINNFVKHISRQFYENKEKSKYMNLSTDINTEDGNLLNVSNISSRVSSYGQNSYVSFKGETPNKSIISKLAKINNVSQNELFNIIEKVKNNEEEVLKETFLLIFTIFFIDEKNSVEDICSHKFLASSLNSYSKSNTKEKNVINLKANLKRLCAANSEIVQKTSRVATVSSYNKALFLYLVISSQSLICNH